MTDFPDFCPFRGIEPFSEADSEFFFGREYESELVATHLISAPLTIFYGGSGVGKTSVLCAGAVPFLRKLRNIPVIVFRSWQYANFISALKLAIADEAKFSDEDKASLSDISLDDLLAKIPPRGNLPTAVILDQFEEYFLYNPDTRPNTEFETQLSAAINRADVHVNFLLSLRDDGLSLLNRFNRRIPNLFNNHLRLERLNRTSAERAIRLPLKRFNERCGDHVPNIEIDDGLVSQLLDECSVGQETKYPSRLSDNAKDGAPGSAIDRIETPMLQLALVRLWEREPLIRVPRLRHETLVELGGVRKIISTHLDEVLSQLSGAQLKVCSRIFDRLVTPSGRKIAYSESDLRNFADGLEGQVAPVLEFLSDQHRRILRRVKPPVDPASERETPVLYEIFHDVLSSAVVEWRRRFEELQERNSDTRRRRLRLISVAAAAAILIGVFALWYELWLSGRPWAYIQVLNYEKTYELRKETVTLGRPVQSLTPLQREIPTDIPFDQQTISRLHMILQSNESAIDVRSTNGSTVNAVFLPYGERRRLKDGDIVTLAGAVAFIYNSINYLPLQFWPARIDEFAPQSGWALFIDGNAKAVTFLTKDQHFLSRDVNGRFAVSESNDGKALLVLGKGSSAGSVSVRDLVDDIPLIIEAKESDDEYKKYPVPVDQQINLPGSIVYWYGESPFQIVPIDQGIANN